MRLDELCEGWGRRYIPGFGSGYRGHHAMIFRRTDRNAIGARICSISDPAVRADLGQWFARAFLLDRPQGEDPKKRGAFNPEEFAQMAATGKRYYFEHGTPRWQERHFWHFAMMIREEPDVHRRVYLCHWLCSYFQDANEDFVPSRWEDNCNIPEQYREWKPESRKKGLDHDLRSSRVGEPDDEY